MAETDIFFHLVSLSDIWMVIRGQKGCKILSEVESERHCSFIIRRYWYLVSQVPELLLYRNNQRCRLVLFRALHSTQNKTMRDFRPLNLARIMKIVFHRLLL